MTGEILIKCESALETLAEFLKNHRSIFDGCMVDFITKDIFDKVLEKDLQNELLKLNQQEIIELPGKMMQSDLKGGTPLDTLIKEMSLLTLENLKVTTSKEQLFDAQQTTTKQNEEQEGIDKNSLSNHNIEKKGRNTNILCHFDRFMSQKKMHEVLMLSETVSEICHKENVKSLVDVGSGKAYLSQVLSAMQKHLAILAIDSQSGNLKGAQKRSANLEKQWEALIRRAQCRASGQDPPRRGKKGKVWKNPGENPEKNPKENPEQNPGENPEEIPEEIPGENPEKNPEKNLNENPEAQEKFPSDKQLKNHEKPNQKEESKVILENLKYDTLFVDTQTDLKQLFSTHFDEFDATNQELGLMGLHTCGDLAANSLQIFLANDCIKFCCNVGCCYHLLNEEFYTKVLHKNEENGCAGDQTPCFPMSKLLKEQKFSLGKNARMVAAQPMDRAINNKQMPSQSLLWRAILQHLLLLHNPELGFQDQQVGRIAAKSANFVDYVQKSFVKLGLQLKMNAEELESIYDSMSIEYGQKLNTFYQLRSLFAPLIEGLILLDRLTFLLEQPEVQEAHLVRLFDAVISPRCYALIVNKGTG